MSAAAEKALRVSSDHVAAAAAVGGGSGGVVVVPPLLADWQKKENLAAANILQIQELRTMPPGGAAGRSGDAGCAADVDIDVVG